MRKGFCFLFLVSLCLVCDFLDCFGKEEGEVKFFGVEVSESPLVEEARSPIDFRKL